MRARFNAPFINLAEPLHHLRFQARDLLRLILNVRRKVLQLLMQQLKILPRQIADGLEQGALRVSRPRFRAEIVVAVSRPAPGA